ncbi:MAG: NAD(P)/FAD-dependent oxidoreductase [Dehalococcoidia bacterium]|nr:NAD(P)/FAD-dependent oxidoreductase [Dehalococcoidia bacterium]
MTTGTELDADVAIVGAGVVGLAIATELGRHRSVVVIERHDGVARETSSHNSQVVHAGIYYPTGSLKHVLCIEGREQLYTWCETRGVPVRRSGKLIVATHESELGGLDGVWRQALANGVEGMSRMTAAEARERESAVPAVGALLSSSSGVVDALAFARSLEGAARSEGVLFAFRHEVQGAHRDAAGFTLSLGGPDGEASTVRCSALVNSAGHGAPALAGGLAYDLDGGGEAPILRQLANKGRYYDIVSQRARRAVSASVYPVPPGNGDMPEYMRRAGGLGVHITVDIEGVVHLGPDVEWLDDATPLDYRADDTRRAEFLAAGQRLLPALEDDDIAPGQIGYRPKLHSGGEDPGDFVIWGDRGYVHLGGIESPGLTASLAIARRVAALL